MHPPDHRRHLSGLGNPERFPVHPAFDRTKPSAQDRLLELVIANNEASSWKAPGYRSANFHKSRDGARAVNVSLWESDERLIEAISEMAATDVNLEETLAIANPDFRFYALAYADHA